MPSLDIPGRRRRNRDGKVASLFRSEEMTLAQMFIPTEIAQPTVAELGELGVVEFRDLNPELNPFQRAFVNEIRRLDESERRVRFLWSQCDRTGLPVRKVPRTASLRARSQMEIDQLEVKLSQMESRIRQMNNSGETLNRRYLELTELRHVLRETAVFFEEAESRQAEIMPERSSGTVGSINDDHQPMLAGDIEGGKGGLHDAPVNQNLGFVTGVIPRKKMGTFERILWRAFRGNLFMNAVEIDEVITDPVTDEQVFKNVFVIFAHGREILNKSRRLSESLGATLYPISDSAERRREDTLEVTARLEDLNEILSSTQVARRTEIAGIAEEIDTWNIIIAKEKAIYHTMNMFHVQGNRKTLMAEGWIPTPSIGMVQDTLKMAAEQSGSSVGTVLQEVRTHRAPPTFHRTNKFTEGFQSIVDAYGAARYQEVNPGLYTIITFPFLFSVMFGDFGHGIMITLVGLAMVLRERKLSTWTGGGEIFDMMFGGRYMILLMGLFSIYTGLIYNDMVSKMMSLFESGWEYRGQEEDGRNIEVAVQTGVYPIGIDWNWQFADNKLLYFNSIKMKMSVIIGVTHMLFAILLTVYNHIHFRQKARIFVETIPQFLFMAAIFGYLVFMIFFKWLTDWETRDISPPGLLNMLIYMFLNFGTVERTERFYEGQATVQIALVIVAVLMVPVILLGWPLIQRQRMKKQKSLGYSQINQNASPGSPSSSSGEGSSHSSDDPAPRAEVADSEEESFGSIMMHQVIHTIEFVLGTISNTASYLRLWALSLAHAQLSEVLWDMVLAMAFNMGPGLQVVGIFFLWGGWFVLTVFVLLLMEGLSAFLHALRLHWVEFQSKFYLGDGYLYQPFAFSRILKEVQAEMEAAVAAAGAAAAQQKLSAPSGGGGVAGSSTKKIVA